MSKARALTAVAEKLNGITILTNAAKTRTSHLQQTRHETSNASTYACDRDGVLLRERWLPWSPTIDPMSCMHRVRLDVQALWTTENMRLLTWQGQGIGGEITASKTFCKLPHLQDMMLWLSDDTNLELSELEAQVWHRAPSGSGYNMFSIKENSNKFTLIMSLGCWVFGCWFLQPYVHIPWLWMYGQSLIGKSNRT